MLNGKSILITGGTGSFGKKCTEAILKRYKPRRLIVFSRDELKQYEMEQVFSAQEYPCMRYFIGDVRDIDRLLRAFSGVDYIIHAAAMKHVPAAEYKVRSNTVFSNLYSIGIYGNGTYGCKVENNVVTGNSIGIHVHTLAYNNIISNNTLDGLAKGIYIESTAGAGNRLYNNNITNCTTWGVEMAEGVIAHWFSTSSHIIENNPVRMEGNITIMGGGNMTWRNAQLQYSPNNHGNYTILVKANGWLRLLDGTNFTSISVSQYLFKAQTDSYLWIIDSEVSNVGYAAAAYYDYGLYIETNNFLLDNATIFNNQRGVIVDGYVGWGNPIKNSTIRNNVEQGLQIAGGSTRMVIYGCTITGNGQGIQILQSDNITISNCNISGNSYGFYFQMADYSTIRYNTIQDNLYGTYLLSSKNNLIYHNRFISNTNPGYDDGINSYYNGHPMGGNYWSTHSNVDVDIDGYADSPLTLDGGSQDLYPFALDYGWLRLAPTTPGDWVISWTQRYHNQTISFAGNIILEEGAKAYFDDNVMNVANLIINPSSIFKLHDTTIYCRNISIGGTLSGDPSDIFVEGDVWIDGKLILDGDTLYMNNSFNGQYGIFVNATGHLELRNDARITANNTANRYLIHFKPDSTGRLFDSNISYCGWDMTNIGMLVETNNMVIQRMTFYECLYATEFRGPINVNMYNSTIEGGSARAFRLNGGAIVSAVNCSIGVRMIEVMDPGSTFYLKWFLNVKVENGNGYPIAGAEVSVKDGGGISVGTWYTGVYGRAYYIECAEYRKTQGGTFPYPQPYDVLASYTTFSGSANANMNKTVYLTIILNIPAYKSSGNYTSTIYSAGYNAYWSFIKWDESLPSGTTVTVWVRTGVTVIQTSNTWTDWIQVNTSTGSAIPAAKWTPYIQFKIHMTTADTNVAPLVYQISIAYSPKFLHSITGYDDFGAPGSILYNLTRTLDGNILLQRPGGNYVDNGTYLSPVIDAGEYLDLWRELFWYGSEGLKNDVEFYARTGEVPIPDVSWSGWALVNSPITSPDHRYIQMRAELSTTDPSTTPIVGGIQILGDVSSSTSSFELRTEVGVPVLHEFYMRKTSDDSDVFNKQIDAATEYYFFMRANYSIGWSDNIQLDIWSWHDGGDESSSYDNAVADRSKANTQFHMRYASGPMGAEGIWQMLYPVTEEVHIISYQEDRVFIPGLSSEEDHRWLRVDFFLGPQVRNASSGGVWSVSPDNGDSLQSFNDLHSWNVEAKISDNAYTTASSSWYDEFGIYRYLSISSSGTPAGGGAPGASGVSLQPGANISYVSNTAYYVNVSVTDLWDSVFANKIGAGNISVWNINATSAFNSTITTPTNFIGHEIPLYVWYNQTQTYMAPADYGNSTVGDTGIPDQTTWLAWYIDIPSATPEGLYRGTIRYVIYYDG